MDKQTWQFINTFAPWLSAIGTISAVAVVVTSVGKTLRVRVNRNVRNLLTRGKEGDEE